MKKSLLTIIALFSLSMLFADDALDKQLKKSISVINKSEDKAKVEKAVANLSDMAGENSENWVPLYYAALGQIKLFGFAESNNEKDEQLDLADVYIKQLMSISSDDSEVVTLHAYALIMRLTVDPASRGMHYSGEIFDNLYKAIRLDSNNPRPQFLMGRMKIGTAQFMGTGYGDACKNLKRANEIYAKGNASKSAFSPSWGEKETAVVVENYCKG